MQRALVAAAFIFVIAVAWVVAGDSGRLDAIFEPESVRARLQSLGWLGPAVVVGLMTAAILISPVPSAPIALAAGAAYGHGWGTFYIALGAEIGALSAFALARYLGQDFVQRCLGPRITTGLAGSQRALMMTVFVSRLLPFVSFDLVSYAAGLTVLSFTRFAIATFAGILPASFVLAHYGAELSEAIVAVDDALRRVAYTITAGPFPLEFHAASMQVSDAGGGRSTFCWTTDLKPDSLAEPFDGLMGAEVAQLSERYGS